MVRETSDSPRERRLSVANEVSEEDAASLAALAKSPRGDEEGSPSPEPAATGG